MYRKNSRRLLFLGILLVVILFWLPTPYVIIQPGKAEAVHSMVEIDEGYEDQQGALMLTTVRMTYSNAATYLKSYIDPHADIRLRKDVLQGKTQQEYTETQEYNMVSSQSSALQAAYLKAGIPFEISTAEVRALGTVEGMPADGVLEIGDRIIKFNNQDIGSREDLVEMIGQHSIGDTIQITFVRKNTEKTVPLQIGETAEKQPAIGVYLANVQTIQPEDHAKQVRVAAGDIGGPSAGLIFALEIYNRLVPEDITKGYQIAGTGEINPLGIVGSIGGVNYKIVAADRAGAEIFFTPEKNAQLANEQAKIIGTDMEIITVKTLDEALAYIDSLPVK